MSGLLFCLLFLFPNFTHHCLENRPIKSEYLAKVEKTWDIILPCKQVYCMFHHSLLQRQQQKENIHRMEQIIRMQVREKEAK